MKSLDLAGAKVLVVGMARSGLAAVALLAAKGAHPIATDAKPIEQLGEAQVRLEALGVPFRPQSDEVFEQVDRIVLSPGVPADLAPVLRARERGVPVIGEVELAGWFLEGPILGITGSNGKTTTTSLVGHILRASGIAVQVGGNIGTPPTAMVGSSRAGQWNVLELSSFQLELIDRFRARVAVALNVTPNHLDRHPTFAVYAAAKARLFQTQQPGDWAVLNADDPTCVSYGALTAGQALWFSLDRAVDGGAWVERNRILFDGRAVIEVREIPLRGRHNIENALAATVAARLAGAAPAQIAAAIRTFPGVEHRLEFVREIGGVRFYNDSKATSVDAALKAVDALPGPLWIILGGKDKGSDYRPLGTALGGRARAALLVGAAAPIIREHLSGSVPLIDCQTIDVALERAFADAVSGDTVLLAPACASFDQFENFEHRGRVFKALVSRLGENN